MIHGAFTADQPTCIVWFIPLHTPAVTMSMNAVIGDVTLMTGLVGGANYSMNQAIYDLARLGINGLITRIPGRNRYRLTHDGLAFAIFYPKVHDRLLRPLLAADEPPAPPPIRKALHTIDIHITQRIEDQAAAHRSLKLKATLNVLATKVR